MKFLKPFSSTKIFIAIMLSALINLVNGEIAVMKIPGELLNNGYYIESCAHTLDKETSLLLFYRDNTNPDRHYRAYASVDSNGILIQQPDSVCITELQFLPSQVLFDNSGRLFIYSNNGDRYCDNLFRISYDPDIRSSQIKQFGDINIGIVKCAQNIPDVGNIVLLNARSVEEPLMSLVVDDWRKNSIRLIDFKIEDTDNLPVFFEAIQELPDNRLLIIGCRTGGPGTNEDYPLRIIKYIFDLQKEEILSRETMPISEIINSCSGQYVLPWQNKETIFKANGHYFYWIPIESGNKSTEHVSNNIFIELDSEGNFIFGAKATKLIFDDSALVYAPNNYIPFVKYVPQTHINKLWIMSLDNFPIIMIDKGE